MSHIPEIEIHPVNGPRLILSDGNNKRRDLCLTSDGSVCLSGDVVTNIYFTDIDPVIITEETGTSGWSLKASLNGDFNAGDYEITISFNWRCTTASKSFRAEIVCDDDFDNPLYEMEQRAKTSNKSQKQPVTKFIRIDGLSAGTHKFELWFSCEDSTKLAYMSDVYFKIERKG
jgi:hypothetical protein